MEKVLKVAYWIVTATLLAGAILMFTALFSNYKIKIVMSGSMEPTIRTGSLVIIKPEARYSIGDIVTFGKDTEKDIPITHRLVEMRVQDGVLVYRTKGDANQTKDINEVPESSIIGKVLFSVPFLGFVLDFAKKPFGFFIVVLLPALAIISDELKSIWSEFRKLKKKDE